MISFVKFSSMSVKGKMHIIQDRLNELGFNVPITYKRDKNTIKALTIFQKNNGITPNGIVCERTYNKLFKKEE